MKHLVSIGGGLSSTIELPMEVIRKYGAENVDLVIACLKGEHPDLWRLVDECERLTNKRVMRIAYCPERASKYVIHAPESYWWSIWDVFEKEGRMGSSLADPCSRVLKRETLRNYILRTYPNGGTVIHVGIKPDEIDRQMAILSNNTFTLGTDTPTFVFLNPGAAADNDTGYTTTCPTTSAGAAWTVTHSLGSKAIGYAVYRTASPFDEVDVYATRDSTSVLTITADVALASGEYTVVVWKVA